MMQAITLPNPELQLVATLPGDIKGIFGIDYFINDGIETLVVGSKGKITCWPIGTETCSTVQLKENSNPYFRKSLLHIGDGEFLCCCGVEPTKEFLKVDSVSIIENLQSLIKHSGKIVGISPTGNRITIINGNNLKDILLAKGHCNSIIPTNDENIILALLPFQSKLISVNIDTGDIKCIKWNIDLFIARCICMLDNDHVAIGCSQKCVIINIRNKKTVEFNLEKSKQKSRLSLSSVGKNKLAIGSNSSNEVDVVDWISCQKIDTIQATDASSISFLKTLPDNRLAVGTDKGVKIYSLPKEW